MPGITPAKISAMMAHRMLLVALRVAMSPAFAALYIFQILRNTINETANNTKYTMAGRITKMPNPTTVRTAKAAIVHKAAAIQTIIKRREKMKAISMYVLIEDRLVLELDGGGGGGVSYVIFFHYSFLNH